MDELNSDAVPSVRENVFMRDEYFGMLVFTNRTPLLAFDGDAASILRLCDGSRTVREIAQDLTESYQADQLLSTVQSFVAVCLQLGLVDIKLRRT